jgi:hypothetical protein
VIKSKGLLAHGTLLEIGCGPYGIGSFRKVPFTGCDLSFANKEQWPMTQLAASAADLPLADRSFDIVLASDILEHIPPSLRVQVIKEATRVADKLIIFGFPCGEAAHESDRALRSSYLEKNQAVPGWLEEHMEASFPEPDLFDHLPGWKVEHFANESLHFHRWMMKAEMNYQFVRVTSKLVRVFPKPLELFLKRMDGSPSYRQIFVLTRTE